MALQRSSSHHEVRKRDGLGGERASPGVSSNPLLEAVSGHPSFF